MTTRREVENSKIRFVFELLELLSSSSSSSSDEDEYFKTPHKIRKIGNFIELVHECTDKEFKSHFRIARSTAYKIIDIYADSQFYPSDRTHGGSEPTSAELDILSFLWFAGNKVCLRDVSQRFGVCPVTSLRQHNRVMNYLINLAPNIMKFDEKEQVANEFFEVFLRYLAALIVHRSKYVLHDIKLNRPM
ncbi:PREDICTED: uncharacterized protein LOC108766492 isoform X3 [Trachymyrmex cornetzi]|uniref:uncharacterized protein LOC108766492 isoform X3 n=1 Tax=Trachymyrmex cornetzi TaxID=471704 RepID=UPI00084EDA58|nr:PREDICTED: uncharacterized protein LOC108766492 isoform X3 [Trachymyrmex cornetzi]